MKIISYVSLTIVIIGAINWGLIGFFGLNLIDSVFGVNSILSRLIYCLVGICGLYCITYYFLINKM